MRIFSYDASRDFPEYDEPVNLCYVGETNGNTVTWTAHEPCMTPVAPFNEALQLQTISVVLTAIKTNPSGDVGVAIPGNWKDEDVVNILFALRRLFSLMAPITFTHADQDNDALVIQVTTSDRKVSLLANGMKDFIKRKSMIDIMLKQFLAKHMDYIQAKTGETKDGN